MSSRVTIGLPVKNGADYVGGALKSLLDQTFTDFRLLISDNASTDETEDACRAIAGSDSRVEYYRHNHDLGAAANYNYVFERSDSPLFTWAAHDDLRDPRYLEMCVSALDAREDAVVAFTGTLDIGPDGEPMDVWAPMKGYESPDPAVRLSDALSQAETFPIFGVMRREAIERSRLHLPYAGSDRAMLAYLAAQGPFIQIDEPLFLHRQHSKRSVYSARNRRERMEWWDPGSVDRLVVPNLMLTRDYWRAIMQASLTSRERRDCLTVLVRDVMRRRRSIVIDSAGAARFWLRQLIAR